MVHYWHGNNPWELLVTIGQGRGRLKNLPWPFLLKFTLVSGCGLSLIMPHPCPIGIKVFTIRALRCGIVCPCTIYHLCFRRKLKKSNKKAETPCMIIASKKYNHRIAKALKVKNKRRSKSLTAWRFNWHLINSISHGIGIYLEGISWNRKLQKVSPIWFGLRIF